MPKITVTEKEFLNFIDLIDRYLIEDIKTMLTTPDKPSGGLGFSTLQIIISGMELIGRMLTTQKSTNAFNAFWQEIVIDNPEYAYDSLNRVFTELIRNGTAHYFMVKSGIQVHLHEGYNLGIAPTGNLHINCSSLFGSFLKTYLRLKKEFANKPNKFLPNFIAFVEDIENPLKQNHLNDYKSELSKKDQFLRSLEYYGSSASLPFNYNGKDISAMAGASGVGWQTTTSGTTFVTKP